MLNVILYMPNCRSPHLFIGQSALIFLCSANVIEASNIMNLLRSIFFRLTQKQKCQMLLMIQLLMTLMILKLLDLWQFPMILKLWTCNSELPLCSVLWLFFGFAMLSMLWMGLQHCVQGVFA